MVKRLSILSVVLGCGLWVGLVPQAVAIPGESADDVEAWIEAHPTLRPSPNERLVVHRVDTPARRFTFRATVFPVSGVSPGLELQDRIRTEQMTLVDIVDGLSADRLEESLRAIYDANIYNDYRRAEVLYRYPNSSSPFPANAAVLQQGEVREGDRFGYWLELTANPSGFVYSGRITVFLKEDISQLIAELQGRGTDEASSAGPAE